MVLITSILRVFIGAALLSVALVSLASPASAAPCPTVSDATLTSPSAPQLVAGNYEVASEENLQWIIEAQLAGVTAHLGYDYLQTADLDMTGCTWTEGIGVSPYFTGSYDGAGFSISGLTVSDAGSTNVGLFATLERNTIQNLTFRGAVSGGSSVGGLVGRVPAGTISNSAFIGTVSGTGQYIGGLVGDGTPYGGHTVRIESSFASGTIQGGSYVGGLMGRIYNTSTVEFVDSYATTQVSGTTVGGALGYLNPTGTITFTNVFWDTTIGPATTASTGSSPNASGKTTEELQDFDTYDTAGWDIYNGYDSSYTWGICPLVNDGLPFLTVYYATDPCVAPSPELASGRTTYTFSFLTSGGGACLPDVTVVRGSSYTLPGSSVACTPEGTSMVGWSIPGQERNFSAGGTVAVSGSQTFRAVAMNPEITVTYDANVGFSGGETSVLVPCLDSSGRDVSLDDRAVDMQVERAGILLSQPVCTPEGYDFAGWTDGPTTAGISQAVDGARTMAPGSLVPQGWNEVPNPVNGIRVYALWKLSA